MIDSSLIHTAGAINYDEVYSIGNQTIAKKSVAINNATGNNYFDVIKTPIVCKINVMVEAVVGITLTPQLYFKFVHTYGTQSMINDAHCIMATHENTALASRYDMNAAELTVSGGTQTLTPHFGLEFGGTSEPTWNKSGFAMQAVSWDVGDLGELNFTVIITDLRRFYRLI